jgi:phage recombination protein Bet
MSNIAIFQAKKLGDMFGIQGDGQELVTVLKATVFKGQVSDAQMGALLIVAAQYGLNPFTKEIYAFPDKQNGIVPVVGVDGWARIINNHPQMDGMDFAQDADSCTCTIYRKDRSHPIKVTEWMAECKRGAGPWLTHPYRMLRHKAMIQAARLAFGFSGIYDEDEAKRIEEATTTRAEKIVAEGVQDTYQAFEEEHLQPLRESAMNGPAALQEAFAALPKGADKTAFWQKHQAALKSAAAAATVVDAETGEIAQ